MAIDLRLIHKSHKAQKDLQKLKNRLNGIDNSQSLILNSTELAGLEFEILHTDGIFHELIGNPSLPFYVMLYGLPGSGKSTLTIQLAKYLASKGLRVLYYAKEESTRHGFSYTLKEKLDRLNAYHENLFFAASLPENLTPYDVLVIDSVNEAELTKDQIERLQNDYPNLSMLLIFQSTKDGQFRGDQTWQHLVDTVIKVENGVATTGKNRFGKGGEVEVFQTLSGAKKEGRKGESKNWWDNIKVGMSRKKLLNLAEANGWEVLTEQGKGSHIKIKKCGEIVIIHKNLETATIYRIKKQIKLIENDCKEEI